MSMDRQVKDFLFQPNGRRRGRAAVGPRVGATSDPWAFSVQHVAFAAPVRTRSWEVAANSVDAGTFKIERPIPLIHHLYWW